MPIYPLLAALVLPAQASEVCGTPFAARNLDAKIDAAEEEASLRDLARLGRLVEGIESSLPCLDTPIEPVQAARFHLLRGIHLWMDSGSQPAQPHFCSAIAVSPGIGIPLRLFPSGHGIHGSFEESRALCAENPMVQASVKELAGLPDGGALFFDGILSDGQPIHRPTIAQVSVDGRIASTELLGAGEPLSFPQMAVGGAEEKESAAPAEEDLKAFMERAEAASAPAGASSGQSGERDAMKPGKPGAAQSLGIELLSYTGLRYSRELDTGRAAGAFLGIHTAYPDLSPSAVSAGALYFFYDLPIEERWQLELRLGTYGGSPTLGVGARYDPPSKFYLNLVAEASPAHFQLLGISIGWLWEVGKRVD
jgi:hypothetical protein